jgi:adenylate cyclase
MSDLSFLTFDQLLDVYFAREGVEDELQRRYGRVAAVLVTDFTEMVARTDAFGVGYALALAAAAQRAMAPVMGEYGGVHIKQVADTAFIVFDDPARALLAALDAQRTLAAFNVGRSGHAGHDRNAPMRGGMGLGFGPALILPGRDVFGPEVNRAFVLGEDVARGGEVLATEAFVQAIGGLPEGVGAYCGPADREVAAGFPFHVLGDYR